MDININLSHNTEDVMALHLFNDVSVGVGNVNNSCGCRGDTIRICQQLRHRQSHDGGHIASGCNLHTRNNIPHRLFKILNASNLADDVSTRVDDENVPRR